MASKEEESDSWKGKLALAVGIALLLILVGMFCAASGNTGTPPAPPPYCGDGSCDSTESCSSCSADCGACPPICKGSGQLCGAPSDCCSNNCNGGHCCGPGETWTGTCCAAAGVCVCQGDGYSPCGSNPECCSGNCNGNHCCPTGTTWDGTCCKSGAGVCVCMGGAADCTTTPCCGALLCSNSHCCPGGTEWLPAGCCGNPLTGQCNCQGDGYSPCGSNPECCSNNCNGGHCCPTGTNWFGAPDNCCKDPLGNCISNMGGFSWYCLGGTTTPPPSSCGTGGCEPAKGETCASCPGDCGVCAPVCPNGICEPPTENCNTCGDCSCVAPGSSCSPTTNTCCQGDGAACGSASDCCGGSCVGGICCSGLGAICSGGGTCCPGLRCPPGCPLCAAVRFCELAAVCGDHTCDTSSGETCATCRTDCLPCLCAGNGESCLSNSDCCLFPGSAFCSDSGTPLDNTDDKCTSCVGLGASCLSDPCCSGLTCDAGLKCVLTDCGDGTCDGSSGETCATCRKDCNVGCPCSSTGDSCLLGTDCCPTTPGPPFCSNSGTPLDNRDDKCAECGIDGTPCTTTSECCASLNLFCELTSGFCVQLPQCPNGLCEPYGPIPEDYTNCRADCPCNNDNLCETVDGENPTNCPGDCGCNGNGVCEVSRAEDFTNCREDCPCNFDGACEPASGETLLNCPSDCSCNNNGVCDSPQETPETCRSDCPCLIDGTCESVFGENFATCPSDCPCTPPETDCLTNEECCTDMFGNKGCAPRGGGAPGTCCINAGDHCTNDKHCCGGFCNMGTLTCEVI